MMLARGIAPGTGGDRHRVVRVARAALVLVALIPALPYLVELPHFGACQYNDYYGILNQVWDGQAFADNPLRWLMLKSNEHTVTLPALIYVANIRLTHGDNRGLSAVAIVLLFVILLLLWRLMAGSLDLEPGALSGGLFLLACLVFSPVSAHSVVMRFSGAIWFLPNALAVAALFLLFRKSGDGGLPLWPALLASALGAISYSTNLSLWPALLAVALIQGRRRRELGAIVVLGVAVGLFFFLGYQPVPSHPPLETAHPLEVLIYSFAYLGGFLAGSVGAAAVAGALGVVSSGVFWTVALRRGTATARRAAPWIGLQLYVLGNALGTGVGRAGFGIHQSLQSRYASLSALFWIGWSAMLIVTRGCASGGHRRLSWQRMAVPVALVLVLVVASWSRGLPVLHRYLVNAHRQPLAAEALRLGIYDPSVIRVLTFIPVTRAEVTYTVSRLKPLHHVPFDRPATSWTGLPGRPIDVGELPAIDGRLDGGSWIGSEAIRISGWVWNPDDPVKEILAVDGSGNVIARMITGLPRPDLIHDGRAHDLFSGWGGYLPPETPVQPIRVVARLGSGRWCKVPGGFEVPPRRRPGSGIVTTGNSPRGGE